MNKESSGGNLILVAVVVIGYLIHTGQIKIPKPVVPVDPVKPVVTVPADLASAAEPIKAIAAGNPGIAKEVGLAMQDFKDMVLRDDKLLATTEDLRTSIKTFETLLWIKTKAVGSMPGYSAAASQVMSTAIGTEVVPLDAAKRARAGQALDAISVALGA